MNVFVSVLGCKLNRAEAEHMVRALGETGYRVVAAADQADLHLVHTCTVTAEAARDSRRVIRRGQRSHGRVLPTVVTGCWAAAEPAAAAAMPGVVLVVPPRRQDELVALVRAALPPSAPAGPAPTPARRRTRAAVKVEDGCSMRCAFCVIPGTRGTQRSRPLQAVVSDVAACVAEGAQEVVLTGVQISAYRDSGATLADLVERVLERTAVPRLRLTSIAPWQFDRRLPALFPGGRVCRHVHLSLQSGCDATLRRMRRPYTAAEFVRLAAEIRAAVPGVAITSDVIAGFPGETEAEFERTAAVVDELSFARLHVFPYSARAGTLASTMADPVPAPVVRERVRRLRAAGDRSAAAFARAQLGSEAIVVWERPRAGWAVGTSDHYLRVRAPLAALRPPLERVRIERVDERGLWAT